MAEEMQQRGAAALSAAIHRHLPQGHQVTVPVRAAPPSQAGPTPLSGPAGPGGHHRDNVTATDSESSSGSGWPACQ